MKTGDLQKAFGVSDTTIRRWTDTFSDFLSDSANKTDSRHRIYTASDYEVMATVQELSKQNYPMDVIRERLISGYRVRDTNAQTVGYEDGRLVPAAAVEQLIDATEVRAELEAIKRERDKLLDQNQRYEARVKELTDLIADLQYRLGRAEMEAQIRREMDEKRRDG